MCSVIPCAPQGEQAAHSLIIPRLRVRRDWFKGLNPDPTDHTKPDIGADKDDSGVGERKIGQHTARSGTQRKLLEVALNGGSGIATEGHDASNQDKNTDSGGVQTVTQPYQISEEGAETFKDLFAEEDYESGSADDAADWLDDELADELSEEDDDEYAEARQDAEDRDSLNAEDFDEDIYEEDYADDGNGHDYVIKGELWEDDIHPVLDHKNEEASSPYVWVDAHVVANPAIGDIDGDGREEIVLAVSYFFDPGDYAADAHRTELAVGRDGDPAKYVASGVAVFDLHSRGLKWTQHLDLSTRYTRYKALAYSAPTLADINGDGHLEIILGTSMGFLYVIDPKTGDTLDGWPVQMGDIQGQVAVADVDGDGLIEIIATDARGSVAVLKPDGKELWERHLGTAIGVSATVGDVDGDGKLEVVLGSFDGRIFVLDAQTGKDRPNFPFRTFGRITAPVMITKLNDPKLPGMQLAATSHDGLVYVIDGITGCADSLDLGEPSYSMVLADDLAASGHLDLLVATVSGNLYALRTAARFQPLKTWPAQVPGPGPAGFSARWNWEGVYVTAMTRLPRDVRGEAVPVRFAVVDNRPALRNGKKRGPYTVLVSLHGVGIKEMNAGDQPIIGMSQVVNASGMYTLDVPCPRTRTSATIRVEMKDESGAVFFDEFALSFHIHFYRLLKWLVVGPFAFTAAALLAYNGAEAFHVHLPS